MKRILHNPYVVFPLGSALAVALIVGWSFMLSDRLDANVAFPVFFLLLPLLAALYSFRGRAHASRSRWIGRWLGTTVLGFLAALVVFTAADVLFPYKPSPGYYNFTRSHYAHYLHGAERRVSAGDKALEETLYTLEGDGVRLSDLWKERPIVVEFGSAT